MTPVKAYRLVRNAIKNGDIVRPEVCQKCGQVPPPTSDGRAGIQGHHHDYEKPLDVEWICAKCHRKETPLPAVMGKPNIGEKNGFSKLTEEHVLEIRASKLSSRALGKIYAVHHRTILRARTGEHWKHIAAAPGGER